MFFCYIITCTCILIFYVINITVDTYFGLTPTNGNIYSKKSLEGASSYGQFNFTVVAEDSGRPRRLSAETYVYINVSSGAVDDGRPVWSAPYRNQEVEIYEVYLIMT